MTPPANVARPPDELQRYYEHRLYVPISEHSKLSTDRLYSKYPSGVYVELSSPPEVFQFYSRILIGLLFFVLFFFFHRIRCTDIIIFRAARPLLAVVRTLINILNNLTRD